MSYFRLKRQLSAALQSLPLDWNGHWLQGAVWTTGRWYDSEEVRKKRLLGNVGFDFEDFIVPTEEDAQAIIDAAANQQPLDRWVEVATINEYGCPYCKVGNDAVLECNGVTLRVKEPCEYPNGLVSIATLNIPSGKVLADDDLRSLCPIAMERDINRTWGQHEMFLDYARHGQAHGQVGNTSPSIYLRNDKTVFVLGRCEKGVGRKDKNGDYDDYKDDPPKGFKKVGRICTDLWAYSVMDYEEAEKRAEALGVDFQALLSGVAGYTRTVFNVEPGLYEVKHYYPHREEIKHIYATFTRISPPTEQPDWIRLWKTFQVTAGQAVQILSKGRKTKLDSEEDWATACASVMSRQLSGCVPSRDWHPNGFRNEFLPEDVEGVPDREIPRFPFQWTWDIGRSMIETAVTRNDRLFGGDAPLNPSYAKAAAHILESVIRYGLPTRLNHETDTYNVVEVRDEMRKAAKLWSGLIERYSDAAKGMDDFALWMQDEEAVEKWIAEFDLGPEKFDREAQKRQELRSLQEGAMLNWADCEVQLRGTDRIGKTIEGQAPEGSVSVQFPEGIEVIPVADLDLTPASEEVRKKRAADTLAELQKMWEEIGTV